METVDFGYEKSNGFDEYGMGETLKLGGKTVMMDFAFLLYLFSLLNFGDGIL